jgi:hypothetical protein
MGMFLKRPGMRGNASSRVTWPRCRPGCTAHGSTVNRQHRGANGSPGMCNMNLNWELDTVYYQQRLRRPRNWMAYGGDDRHRRRDAGATYMLRR